MEEQQLIEKVRDILAEEFEVDRVSFPDLG